jgi:hypothetical protein
VQLLEVFRRGLLERVLGRLGALGRGRRRGRRADDARAREIAIRGGRVPASRVVRARRVVAVVAAVAASCASCRCIIASICAR